jgi:DNA-binding SARP family transcriptional activator
MEFRVLGPLEVRADGRTVPLGGPKPRALLGALLLHVDEVISTERLVDELWGERPPAGARKLVPGYVHALRKQVGRSVLVTSAPGYVARLDSHALDLHEFERLLEEARSADLAGGVELRRRALALWRGPPLADLVFEGPSRHEVSRLAELRLSTQVDRIEGELELGRHTQLIGELESLVALHPYQERPHALLMLALYRSGRQADALRTYREVRTRLSDELGLEPGQGLRELEATMLRQDPSLALEQRQLQGRSEAEAATSSSRPEIEDEIRLVTVLAADVVGSSALVERLSAGDAKAFVGECVDQMSNAVEEFGGTVDSREADGICASFGVGRAREDDPERAVRTGLRILEIVGGYARDAAETWLVPDFAVRVGIDSGRASAARGDISELADRVCRAAPPGAIAVGEETERRLLHRFAFEPLRDVSASRLIGPHAPSRAPALRPLVGRDREVERIEAAAAELAAGRGQALLIVGEPGIGKTRLLAELRARVPDPVTWLEGHCLSYGRVPSAPFVEALRRWLGVDSGDAEIVLRTRARARLPPLLGPHAQTLLPALGRLIGIDLGEHADAQRGDLVTVQTSRSYRAWVEALTRHSPVVLAIEDLQWADASTRELAEDLMGLTDEAPLLLVSTLRRDPESEGWRFRSRMLADFAHRGSELALDPLHHDDASRLLGTLLPGPFDEPTREEIVARAEGNPLYLEELLRALIAGGGLEQRHRTWTTTVNPSRLLPPTLENLLVARIDRLDESARRLAQVAAVIGREFPVSVLSVVAGGDSHDALRRLLRAEIVREVRRYPELVCAFRHSLLQEAALGTLTSARRRELYRRVASAFEELYAGSLGEHRERLAHYHARAGDSTG